ARRMARGLRTGWIALATFLALLAFSGALLGAFTHSTRVADDIAQSDEQELVRRYLHRAVLDTMGLQKSQLSWDEAARNAGVGFDRAWADGEFGRFFNASYGLQETFLVAPDGALIGAWRDGKAVDGGAGHHALRPLIVRLIAQSRGKGHELGRPVRTVQTGIGPWPVDAQGELISHWAGGFVPHGTGVAIMTVAAIVPDHTPGLLTRAPNYVVALRRLDAGTLARFGDDLLLSGLGFVTGHGAGGDYNALPVIAPDGTRIGDLRWIAKVPGPTIIRRTAPLLGTWILFFIGVVAGGTILLRRSRHTARELLASEAQAQHNALHDAMSGLPNRVHYMQRLRGELADCISGKRAGDVFVAYIDIDSFKVVNDTLGHHVGDELVRQVAVRLRRGLPSGDFIARFGGDEFVLLRRAEGGLLAADALGLQVMALMREPFLISGNTLEVSCSCGISWGPEQSEDPGELLRRADIALYRAKQRGRSRYRRFTRDMDASVKLRREMETELRRAIMRDELSVAFQPICAIGTGDVRGFEALLRWAHPERGDIRPGLFVPIAEQGGLMVPLGNWMLRRVFSECRDWPACDISVNLSPLQIMAADFLPTMAAIVAETAIDPRRVVLEVTEGVMLDRSDHVVRVLRELNRMGFRIALDDFGIGYSSLSYLRSFQFDRIKIDRSFVQNIEGDMDAHSILCAIVSLGHTLRMKVVAEGVETESQRRLVQAAGCELVQGHLFWMAMPPEEALALIQREEAAGGALRLVG
ncbi:MAG: hypothetical protein RIS94_2871, partial [Pseudomonadota bacterium]